MRRRSVAGILLIGGAWVVLAGQSREADTILSNGRVITVDERFSIASAVAIRGDRIVAVGADREVEAFARPATTRVDLKGAAVIPGLIDNHLHLLRAGTTWDYEVRLDGIDSRRGALELLRARAKVVSPGEWIYTLGGWALEQFADDRTPFTREELDRVVPIIRYSCRPRITRAI
jgi:predicted amidohydrolase YtcJ